MNPYYANPFFRPRILSRPIPLSPSNCDSSTISSNPLVPPVEPRRESKPTVILTSVQDENRRWAHSLTAASMARRAVSNDCSTGPVKPSAINVSDEHRKTDSTKSKDTFASDMVMSLMDTLVKLTHHPHRSFEDTALSFQHTPLNTSESVLVSSASNADNNQDWRKTLAANFQKNARTIPTAKLFFSKPTPTVLPLAPEIPDVNDVPSIPSLVQQSTAVTPPTLIAAKPPVNVEQQRAIITRVIRFGNQWRASNASSHL